MMSTRSKALALALFTVGYNIVEAAVAMYAAFRSGSIALSGFGLDSCVESLSGMVMIWRFWNYDPASDAGFEQIERRATRLVGCSFLVLGVYIVFDSCSALYYREQPDTSLIGMVLAIASLIIMPVLFVLKYRLGRAIGSPSLVADSKETLACSLLSAALLTGLGSFYLFRWWWIDSAAALLIAGLVFREGREALRE